MHLKQQLTEDMKQAMRDRDALKLSVIRFLLAEIKNKEIDEGELDDDKISAIINRQVKQIREVMTDYQKAGKDQQLVEEEQKAKILESYLPEQLSDDQLQSIVEQVYAESDDKSMGSLIKQIREKAGSSADGGKIAMLVKQKLS